VSNGSVGPTRRAIVASIDELVELRRAAAVALIVLRRALVEGASVTREAVAREAAVVFQTDSAQAASRLDAQAQSLGISSLM
jgi:hypothetical protein